MRVSETTKYSEYAGVEKYLKDEDVKELTKAAQRQFVAYEGLTFAQFSACCNGNFEDVLGNCDDPTVYQIYWCKGFGAFAKTFADTLKNLQVPQTPEEQQAANGLPAMTFNEGMLVFVRSYFGLQSFAQAEQVTLGEILIAKHDSYYGAMYQRKLHQIQIKKAKAKK